MDTNSLQPSKRSNVIEKESLENIAPPVLESKKPLEPNNSLTDLQTQQAIDHATGLLQTIVSDKLSGEVLRKMPSDEYLHLLTLLDNIISGSIDKRV